LKASIPSTVVAALLVGCSGAPVEEGFFFPTWSAEGDVPAGEVFGSLIEDDRCLYVEANDQRTLVVWEDGMGFENGALLDASGSPIAQVGEAIHGGGGYYGSRSHIENLSGSRFRNDVFRRALTATVTRSSTRSRQVRWTSEDVRGCSVTGVTRPNSFERPVYA
jgi:hypothetical protein